MKTGLTLSYVGTFESADLGFGYWVVKLFETRELTAKIRILREN